QRSESSSDQPAGDQKPTTIVVRSVLPPDLKEKEKRVFVLRYGLTRHDFARLEVLDAVKCVVPLRLLPQQEIRHQQNLFNARLAGTTGDYAKVNRFEMAAGRFLKDNEDQPDKGDEETFRNVIVLGARVAEELFPSEDLKKVVGKAVVLDKQVFKVIG